MVKLAWSVPGLGMRCTLVEQAATLELAPLWRFSSVEATRLGMQSALRSFAGARPPFAWTPVLRCPSPSVPAGGVNGTGGQQRR
jgi:hypothetical protein